MTAARKATRKPAPKSTRKPARKRAGSKGTPPPGSRLLHLSGVGTVVLGFLSLLLLRLANAPSWDADAWGYLALGGFAMLSWCLLALGARRAHAAPELGLLLLPVAFLVGFGLLVQHRVKGIDIVALSLSDFAYPAGIALLLAVLFTFRHGRIGWLTLPGDLYIVLSLGGMIALLLLGSRYRGAVFAAGRMTPTELLKPVLAIYLAAFMSRTLAAPKSKSARGGRRKRKAAVPWGRWLWLGITWGLLMALLAYQRDLGMMVILNGMLVFVLVAATSAYWLLPVAAVGAALAGVGATLVLPHVRQRIDIWLDPFSATTGAGWQQLQSLAALYNGGLLGAGFGEGSPQTIPVASSDFIYAAIGEELGLLGCLALVAVLGMLLVAGFRIAATCKDRFGSLLATALSSVLALQIILNLGGVTKALPMTGVPLPFLSHGGSNLLVSFATVGLLAAISAFPKPRGK